MKELRTKRRLKKHLFVWKKFHSILVAILLIIAIVLGLIGKIFGAEFDLFEEFRLSISLIFIGAFAGLFTWYIDPKMFDDNN